MENNNLENKNSIIDFEDMKLDTNILSYLKSKKYTRPTPIQCRSFELLQDNIDFIGCSPTGTGKTIAYILPLTKKIDSSSNDLQAIIVSPTYELNRQIHNQLAAICKTIGIRTLLLNGDGNLPRQLDYLKAKPHIIVGSMGRIQQLINMKKVKCHKVDSFIIDEADKLINKNTLENTMNFRKNMLKYCHIYMYSASMDEKAIKSAKDLMNNEIIVANLSKNFDDCPRIPDTITHYYVICERNSRLETVRSLCAALNPKKCMMFTNNKYDIMKFFDKLSFHGYNIDCLSGNSSKANRTKAIKDFSNDQLQYLISTDIAARGLHFENVSHIVNINLPEENNEYLHRAGRCGRNNNKGICVSLITANELQHINTLEKRFKIKFTQAKLSKGQFIII